MHFSNLTLSQQKRRRTLGARNCGVRSSALCPPHTSSPTSSTSGISTLCGPRRLVNKETGEKPQSFQSTKPRHRHSEWEPRLAWQLSLPDLGSGFQSLSKGFTSSDRQMTSAKKTLRVGPSPVSTLSARSFSGSSCR